MDTDPNRISIDNEIERSVSNTDKTNISNEGSLIESSYIFEDDCGEPILRQRLLLNFTPIEDLDNDDIQQKCCEFWNFVNSRRELDSLIVNPKPETVPNTPKSNATISIPNHTSSITIDGKEKTAVSVLEFVEEKDLISPAFRSRMPTLICDVELKDYSDDQCISKPRKVKTISKKRDLKRQKIPKDDGLPTSARNMCRSLDDWDLEHPKSMRPPGPVPDLQDSKLKNEVFREVFT